MGIPGDNAQRHWGVKHDAAFQTRAERYWTYGGAVNLASFLAMTYRATNGAKPLDVPPPVEQFNSGIYHPKAAKPCASLREYLAWYRAQGMVPTQSPLASILFYSNNYKFRDLAHIDALVARLEARGIGAVAVFGYPLPTLRPFLMEGDTTPLRVFLALSLGFSKAEDVEELEAYGVPVINLLTSRDTMDEWVRSDKGIASERVPVQLNSPERAGANEPVMIAATEKTPGTETTRSIPIPERVERVAQRTARWITLQEKPNREKRIAFIYYNNPQARATSESAI